MPPAPKQSIKDWNPTTTAKPSKVLLMAGHADFLSSGAPNEPQLNIELVKWAQRNASAYGISDFIEVYLPPSGNLSESDSRSQFSKTTQAITAGKQVIEIHNDSSSGHSGVIPPTGGKKIWQLDGALASAYGSFSVNHRDGLGVPKRGGTILEVGRMDGPTTNVFKSGSSAQKEALYKQLMDPVMRSIAAEKSRTGGSAITPTPSSSSSPAQSSSDGALIVGRVGSTGTSSGNHVHIQESTSSTLSEAQLRNLASKYVQVSGKPLTSYQQGQGFGAGRGHKGIDYPIEGGKPVGIIGKVIAAGTNVGGAACGNGVAFQPPEGPELLICHLQDQSIPPNLPGLSSSSSSGKINPTAATGPTTTALTVETSFKGVPRALRITPGRTILSFITDYDKWIDNNGHKGGDNSTDPGVWIPERFRNWFVKEVDFQWRQGDLRVSIEANNAWGATTITAPTFYEYVQAQTASGEFKMTKDYYGYIRSAGPLCFPLYDEKTGKYEDSCAKNCKEAQDLVNAIRSSGGSDGANGSTSGSFPQANCRTGSANKDEVINALYSVGVNTKNAFAGVLGNFQAESGIQANRHNLANPGSGCSSTSGGPLGSVGYGIAQWCGSRQASIFNKCKRNSNLSCEMQFMVQEIREGKDVDPAVVRLLNSASSPSEAADVWNEKYEKGPGGIQKRRDEAERIISQIKCDKP